MLNKVFNRALLSEFDFQHTENFKDLTSLLNFKYEILKLENYQSQGKIAAPVAV